MPLTGYVRTYGPTRKLFAKLPDLKDKFRPVNGPRKWGAPLRVPRTAADPKIVGTAFDYWMRAWLARTWPGVPRQEGQWIAEKAFDLMTTRSDVFVGPPDGELGDGSSEFSEWRSDTAANTRQLQAIERRLREVRILHTAYIAGADAASEDYLRGCLFLARLDHYYRADRKSPDYFRVDQEDLDDLEALARLATERQAVFAPKRRLILNPGFGQMEQAVDGADADVLIDNQLIDIKVLSYAKGPWVGHQHQLIGYWLLAAMQGEPWPIDKLGIYLARDGELYTLPVRVLAERTDLVRFAKALFTEIAAHKARIAKSCEEAGQSPAIAQRNTIDLDGLEPAFGRLRAVVTGLRKRPESGRLVW